MSHCKWSTKPGFRSNVQVTASARHVKAVTVFAAGLYNNHLHCSRCGFGFFIVSRQADAVSMCMLLLHCQCVMSAIICIGKYRAHVLAFVLNRTPTVWHTNNNYTKNNNIISDKVLKLLVSVGLVQVHPNYMHIHIYYVSSQAKALSLSCRWWRAMMVLREARWGNWLSGWEEGWRLPCRQMQTGDAVYNGAVDTTEHGHLLFLLLQVDSTVIRLTLLWQLVEACYTMPRIPEAIEFHIITV